MKLTVLGNNSALPAFGRHPTAQALSVAGDVVLIDCGEGTQIQMQRFAIRWRKLRHIFISHMHGDHYFGLPGLINSMSLMGRAEPLNVFGPPAIKTMLDMVHTAAETVLSYDLRFHPLPDAGGVIFDHPSYTLTTFPVEHRIPCYGLLVATKMRPRKILPKQCSDHNVPFSAFESLKDGSDYVSPSGKVIPNDMLTAPGSAPTQYAYCADTIYTGSFLPWIQGVTALYHESTYLHADQEKAQARFHSTAVQAASLARAAGVKKLFLGHFSSKYRELEAFYAEASALFPDVVITEEGHTYEL